MLIFNTSMLDLGMFGYILFNYMKQKKHSLLAIFFITLLFFGGFSLVYAQSEQIVETIVGDPQGSDGGDDRLGSGEFKLPFKCGTTYQGHTYGPSSSRPDGHTDYAVDFNRTSGEDRGDPVLASANGKVIGYTDWNGEIYIVHKGDYRTLYAHMRKISVKVNDTVRVGQKIGEISDIGRATGPHLHVGHKLHNYDTNVKVKYDGEGYDASLKPSRDYYGSNIKARCS